MALTNVGTVGQTMGLLMPELAVLSPAISVCKQPCHDLISLNSGWPYSLLIFSPLFSISSQCLYKWSGPLSQFEDGETRGDSFVPESRQFTLTGISVNITKLNITFFNQQVNSEHKWSLSTPFPSLVWKYMIKRGRWMGQHITASSYCKCSQTRARLVCLMMAAHLSCRQGSVKTQLVVFINQMSWRSLVWQLRIWARCLGSGCNERSGWINTHWPLH